MSSCHLMKVKLLRTFLLTENPWISKKGWIKLIASLNYNLIILSFIIMAYHTRGKNNCKVFIGTIYREIFYYNSIHNFLLFFQPFVTKQLGLNSDDVLHSILPCRIHPNSIYRPYYRYSLHL